MCDEDEQTDADVETGTFRIMFLLLFLLRYLPNALTLGHKLLSVQYKWLPDPHLPFWSWSALRWLRRMSNRTMTVFSKLICKSVSRICDPEGVAGSIQRLLATPALRMSYADAVAALFPQIQLSPLCLKDDNYLSLFLMTNMSCAPNPLRI